MQWLKVTDAETGVTVSINLNTVKMIAEVLPQDRKKEGYKLLSNSMIAFTDKHYLFIAEAQEHIHYVFSNKRKYV